MTGCPPPADAGRALDDWRAELARDYELALPEKYDQIEGRLAALCRTPDSVAAFDALLAAVHRLHGSAGSFGFVELSRQAGEWERQLLELRAAARVPGDAALAHMQARLGALRQLAAGAAHMPPAPGALSG